MTLGFRVDVATFNSVIDSLRSIVEESKLRFDETGLSSTAVDAANVAMVDVTLDAELFDRLNVDDGESILGANLETLSDVCGQAQSGDDLIAELDPETRKLNLEFPATGLEYQMALIDPDSIRQEPDIPDLELEGRYTISGETLNRGLSATDLVSDHIAIRGIDADSLMIRAEGDTDETELLITSETDLLDGAHDGDEDITSLFSLDYLNDVFGPVSRDTPISIRVGGVNDVSHDFERLVDESEGER
jgi:proliferating cell nuclear antigen